MPMSSKVQVRVYFDDDGFTDVVEWAEKSGFRRKGLFLYVPKKKDDPDGPKRPNTKGLAKFLHRCFDEYKLTDGERTVKMAQLQAEKERIAKEEARLWRP